ncbi:MAG: L,D-transpeptidase family protein [bacterium]
MYRILTCTTLLFLLIIPISVSSRETVPGRPVQADIAEYIKTRITEDGSPPNIIIGEERIHNIMMLARFYRGREFSPAWTRATGASLQAGAMIRAIEDARDEGLTPDYYHLMKIKTLLSEIRRSPAGKSLPDPETLSDLDLLLTDAFLLLSCHLSAGCVNPVTLDVEWHADRGSVDVVSILETALKENLIEETLINLLPSQYGYSRLRQSLAHYRKKAEAGGWPDVSKGPSMKKGLTDKRVIELSNRLIASGDLEPGGKNADELFDDRLEQAVISFQKQHGLDTDGVVGQATLNALNVPVEARIRQIEINMERLRWIPRDLGQRYIIVNIANFELDVLENSQTVLSMKVVVGKDFWHTPVFRSDMTYLEFNPYWNVPKNILIRDILPKMEKDPDYLSKINLKAVWVGQGRTEVIDPKAMDWSQASDSNFHYRLRQDPGPQNPLGRIKFMFPNRFNVYLHDTPVKGLFAKNVRTFSHGCIRIEKPMELAEYLLKSDPSWTADKIQAAIDDGRNKAVRLARTETVYVLYLTAWVDEAGTLQFRDDVYKRDIKLDKTLRKRPPNGS